MKKKNTTTFPGILIFTDVLKKRQNKNMKNAEKKRRKINLPCFMVEISHKKETTEHADKKHHEMSSKKLN